MANISSFRAVRPNPIHADRLVFSKEQSTAANIGCEISPPNLKVLLESSARIRPEIPQVQEQAYKKINHTFKKLLEDGDLWQEAASGIYIYEIVYENYRQTGIWTLTDLDDYTTGRIKTHELTFPDSVRRLTSYREKTGIEGSPVLLTYQPTSAINRMIVEVKRKVAKESFGNRTCFHRIWKISDESTKRRLIREFAQLPPVYLADGHHRLESAAKLKARLREQNRNDMNTFSSLYIATDQLRICEFNRVFLPDHIIDKIQFLKDLGEHFFIRKKPRLTMTPLRKNHHFIIGFDGNWFDIVLKRLPAKGIAAALDASIIQKLILEPLLGIKDPATDNRLKCVGGQDSLLDIKLLMDVHPGAIAFMLCAVSVQQLMDVADANEVMPPKSTWVDPKIPYGLIMYKH